MRKRVRIMTLIISMLLIFGCMFSACARTEGTVPVQIGEQITLGHYQDEDIQWIVLDIQGDEICLISERVLDAKPYSEVEGLIDWENSSLRQWLNDVFYSTAFSEDEKAMIEYTASKEKRGEHNSRVLGAADYDYPDRETEDYVAVLSYPELLHYMYTDDGEPLLCDETDGLRNCEATEYAAQNTELELYHDAAAWWICSPGYEEDSVITGSQYYSVDEKGHPATDGSVGVRPVIWVKM